MKPKGIVAVLTDFGADSFYVGVMKGALSHAAPDCRIVDLTHSVRSHGVADGSFILDTVFEFFPEETVFLVVVDPGVGGTRHNIAARIAGRFFVGPDNGLLTDLTGRVGGADVFTLDESRLDPYRSRPPAGRTFLGRDVFAPAAGALASGCRLSDIGTPTEQPLEVVAVPTVAVGDGHISAAARWVDSFGNILTGITKAHLRAAFGETPLQCIVAEFDGELLGTLCEFYAQRPPGSRMAVLNAWERLEVSVCEGRAIDSYGGRPLEEMTLVLRKTGT
jgi:S-adenosylmethionine hydrolase